MLMINNNELFEAYSKVLEALQKQIPKRPTKLITIKDFNGKYFSRSGSCPTCGQEMLYASSLYCHKCGQKLDWNINENPIKG